MTKGKNKSYDMKKDRILVEIYHIWNKMTKAPFRGRKEWLLLVLDMFGKIDPFKKMI